ncbi:MAG: hypothetical protein IPJ88_17105 [Myxococcales bacterium]|nr:MAG: hypothetical protein IPJ88_17105 [Myxococcales bacterium]
MKKLTNGRQVDSVVHDCTLGSAVDLRRYSRRAQQLGALRVILALAIAALAIVMHAPSAEAQSGPDEWGRTKNALPGAWRFSAPTPGIRGLSFFGSAGFGYTEQVLKQNDTHYRLSGNAAASVTPLDWLGFALKLDGRMDFHSSDSGSAQIGMGEMRFVSRAGTALGLGFATGIEASVWLPGGEAPSLEFDATTLDALWSGSYRVQEIPLTLGVNAGFRLDNSANSLSDPQSLLPANRLTRSLSKSNAALFTVAANYVAGPIEVLAEWTWDLLVGSDAPPISASPMRIAGGARWNPSKKYR